MKKAILLLPVLLLVLSLSTCSCYESTDDADYLGEMCEAAICGDTGAGKAAEKALRTRIARSGSTEPAVSYDELFLLAKYINFKTGSRCVGDEYLLCTGEVLLNRMASEEFPDSMEELVASAVKGRPGFEQMLPGRPCVNAALRLLLGERFMKSSVVYQSEDRPGPVYASFCDRVQGFVYFCESPYTELYPQAEPSVISDPDPGEYAVYTVSVNSGDLALLKNSSIIVYARQDESEN